jgi:hypothetical protein
MKNSLLKVALGLTMFFFLHTNIFAQKTYNLQYKYEKGKNYLYSFDITSKMTQEIQGKDMNVDSDIHNILRFHIDDVITNGDIQIAASLDSAVIKNNIMGNETTVNTDALIGKRIETVISGTGEVKSNTLVDSIDEKYGKMESLSQELQQFFTARFPGKEIKIGESWNFSDVDTIKNLGNGVTRNVDMTCTLSGMENKAGHDCFKIPCTGKFKIKGKASIQGMDFTIEGEGTISGTLYLDEKSGVMIATEISMNNEMTMATTGQQSMVIPITQDVKSVQTLINN